MIEHIVLFSWKEDVSPEAIESALEALEALKGKIEGIVELTTGSNFSERSKGFTHALVVRFEDRGALARYVPHPEHQRVIHEFLDPIRADTLAFDYEF